MGTAETGTAEMNTAAKSSPIQNASIAASDITGLILAGGRGTRMGQVDKGLQALHGKPLYEHVLRRLQAQVGQVIINANQNLAQYQSLGVAVWPDQIDGFAGPLAGMAVGLQHCNSPYLLTVPCDSPFLPLDLAPRLSLAIQTEQADIAVAVTQEMRDGQAYTQEQNVFCLIKTNVLPHLNHFIASGGRKISAWYADLALAQVMFEDAQAFRNLNTLSELAQAELDLSSQPLP